MSRDATPLDVIRGDAQWCVVTGDNAALLPLLPADATIISDPPYGMKANLASTRFSRGNGTNNRQRVQARGVPQGRNDWPAIVGDDKPFDPSPWLAFPRVVLFGSNHYAARLPVGTTLVWIKRSDDLFGTFLSDAEIAWMKSGHGVYCYRHQFPPPSRMAEHNGTCAHPTQKPLGLMRWCMTRAKVPVGALVVDPFAGSGTTGVAAIQTGRRVILCEIDPTYADIARNRCERAAMQPRLIPDAPPPRVETLALDFEAVTP